MRVIELFFHLFFIAIVAAAFAACHTEPQTEPAEAVLTPTPEPDHPDQAAGPEAPPLLPPAESTGLTLDELLKTAERSTTKTKPPPDERDGPALYRWTDENGVTHVVSDPSQVPPRFRAQATAIPGQVRRKKAAAPPSEPYDPGPFNKERRRLEEMYDSWRARWHLARAKADRLAAKARQLAHNPPDCGTQLLPSASVHYNPNCERNWQREIARLRAGARAAWTEAERIREEARRRGVPPGVFR